MHAESTLLHEKLDGFTINTDNNNIITVYYDIMSLSKIMFPAFSHTSPNNWLFKNQFLKTLNFLSFKMCHNTLQSNNNNTSLVAFIMNTNL